MSHPADVNGWCLPGVAGVLLEGKAHDGNALAGDGVEHGLNYAAHKPALLVVIDGNNLHRER